MSEEENNEITVHIEDKMIIGYSMCGIYVDFNDKGHKLIPLGTAVQDINCIPCMEAHIKQLKKKKSLLSKQNKRKDLGDKYE